jgi:uncharacterized repeat protein (TIGR02543 family)
LTFTKGTRHTITFDINGGNETIDDLTNILAGVPIATSIPSTSEWPETPTKTGETFLGWYDAANPTVKYEATSTMPARNLDLKANWAVPIPPITVNFLTANVTANRGTIGNLTGEDEYDTTETSFTFTSSDRHAAFAFFTVTLPTGVSLSDFGKISFNITVFGDDPEYKVIEVVAAEDSVLADINTGNPLAHRINVEVASWNYGSGNVDRSLSFDIDSVKADELSGTLQFGIYIPAEADNRFTCSNFVISQ